MKNTKEKSRTSKLRLLSCLATAFCLVWLTGCDKNEMEVDEGPYDTIIEGYMTERGTGNPISGIQIDLFGPAVDSPREVITDELGFYRFELGLQENSKRFYIDFYGSKWYYNWPGEHYATVQGYNRIDGQLFAAGWVNLHLKNVNHWNGDDAIGFQHGQNYQFNGYYDDYLLLEFPANEPWIFKYKVGRRGETEFYQDTIFPIGHDTINYEILY